MCDQGGVVHAAAVFAPLGDGECQAQIRWFVVHVFGDEDVVCGRVSSTTMGITMVHVNHLRETKDLLSKYV